MHPDTLTWAQPSTKGISPSPRQGHTFTSIGKFLYCFGGTDGKRSFDSLFVFDTGERQPPHLLVHLIRHKCWSIIPSDAMTWNQPATSGTTPRARYRHSATALPNDTLLIWGGIGGGTEVFIFETSSNTWVCPKTSGSPPTDRYNHTAALIGTCPHLLHPSAQS